MALILSSSSKGGKQYLLQILLLELLVNLAQSGLSKHHNLGEQKKCPIMYYYTVAAAK